MTKPKLNAIHLQERIQDHIAKMQRGEEVEARKDKTLLNQHQQQSLKDALEAQKVLKQLHKRPNSDQEKQAIGWKEIRQVRLEIYSQALEQLQANRTDDIRHLQEKREIKAAKVFMEAWSKAGKQGQNHSSAITQGNIAMARAGFNPKGSRSTSKRHLEMQHMEVELQNSYINQLSNQERSDWELLREFEDRTSKKSNK
jgi:hypothetical protein